MNSVPALHRRGCFFKSDNVVTGVPRAAQKAAMQAVGAKPNRDHFSQTTYKMKQKQKNLLSNRFFYKIADLRAVL